MTTSTAWSQSLPVVHDPRFACEELDLMMERLGALFRSNIGELYDLADGLPAEGGAHRQAFSIYLIATLANENFAECHEMIVAIHKALHADAVSK